MAEARRFSRPTLIIGIALVAVIVLGLIAILIGRAARHGDGRGGPATISAPVDGRGSAVLEVLDGVSELRLHADAPGSDLYRITGTGVTPRTDHDGDTFRLRLNPIGDGSTSTLDIAVSPRVTWSLRLDGGTQHTLIDLTAGRTNRIDLAGGSSRIEIALPHPDQPIPVRLTAGVDQFQIRLPAATPVRAQLNSGAGQAIIDGTPHQGIPAGQTFTANGWQPSSPGVDIQATSGIGTLTVEA